MEVHTPTNPYPSSSTFVLQSKPLVGKVGKMRQGTSHLYQGVLELETSLDKLTKGNLVSTCSLECKFDKFIEDLQRLT